MRISDGSSDVCSSDLAVTSAFEAALREGRITEAQLFDRDYKAIPDTDPQQPMAGCVALTDEVLPPLQEPALQFDERVVFCACVAIGRASCRASVCPYVSISGVAVTLKKKTNR